MAESTLFWSGYVSSIGPDNPCFVVYNNDTHDSGRKIHVQNITFQPSLPANNAVSAILRNPYEFVYVSDLNGGNDVPVVKAVSSSTTLTGLVDVKVLANYTSTSNPLRRIFANGLGFTASADRAYAGSLSGARVKPNNLLDCRDPAGATQLITLEEGKGLIIKGHQDLSSFPYLKQINITFNVGSSTYYCTDYIFPLPSSMANIGIFNRVGSGVTVTIVSIDVGDAGSIYVNTNAYVDQPGYRISKIPRYVGGAEVTAFSPVSSTSQHSTTKLIKNSFNSPLVHTYYNDFIGPHRVAFGYPSVSNSQYLILNQAYCYANRNNTAYTDAYNAPSLVGAAAPYGPNKSPSTGLQVRNQSDTQGIILLGGEGLAVIPFSPTSFNFGYLEVWLNQDPPAAGGGGSAAYRVIGSPVVRRISL